VGQKSGDARSSLRTKSHFGSAIGACNIVYAAGESACATGDTMVKLEFHDPAGALEVTQPHAPRLDTIEGKRIGFVSNEQWQAYRMLPMLKSLLEADFPGVEVLPIDMFPQGNALIGTEETARLVAKSGVDAVIVGNAA
jgi:hypothetical protein